MNKSLRIEEFLSVLPDDMREVIKDTSINYQTYLQIANNHLKTLYGDYADWNKCLQAYFNNSDYRKSCHCANECSNIPIIDRNELERMINEETEYTNTVEKMLSLYSEITDSPNDDSYSEGIYQLSEILGLLPEKRADSLYKWFINKDKISVQEETHLKHSIGEQMNLLSVIAPMLAKMFIPGYLLGYPHIGDVMTQQKGRYYYRGENAFYGSSKASYFRNSGVNTQNAIFKIVDRLRMYECWNFLDKFDAVRRWNFSNINYIALEQHYGFRTQMLDLTSNLKTALFFACCRFSKDEQKWYPLKQAEFEQRNSRKDIWSPRSDARYGIVYRTPTEVTDMKWAMSNDNSRFQFITPIGYQPFMRCSYQYGYMMLTNSEKFNLMKDPLFDKFRFRLDEDLCEWIYREMDCGDAVYPNDDVPDIPQYLERRNYQCCFSENVFKEVVKDLGLGSEDSMALREALSNLNFRISGEIDIIGVEELARINSKYSAECAMEKTKVLPQMSPVITV